MNVIFGIIGAAVMAGIVWFVSWAEGETVPAWGWVLAIAFAYENWKDWWTFDRRTR